MEAIIWVLSVMKVVGNATLERRDPRLYSFTPECTPLSMNKAGGTEAESLSLTWGVREWSWVLRSQDGKSLNGAVPGRTTPKYDCKIPPDLRPASRTGTPLSPGQIHRRRAESAGQILRQLPAPGPPEFTAQALTRVTWQMLSAFH